MLSRSSTAAFSLVEVVIALGVVSFAILPMVALLPIGMTTYHDSTEIYLSSEARRETLNNLQQVGIASLLKNQKSYGETNYYNDEGSMVSQVTSSGTTTFSTGTPVYQMGVNVSTLKQDAALVLPQSDATITSSAADLNNSVIVTTQFSRINTASNSSAGGSTFRSATDYLFYNH